MSLPKLVCLSGVLYKLQTTAWYYTNVLIGNLSGIPWWPGPWDLGGGDSLMVWAGIPVESSFVCGIVGSST